jgi:putative DNA modification/repair radical SAM protein
MLIKKALNIYEKLSLLANGAKYDVSCASSGVSRKNSHNKIGNTSRFGICHSWSSDGRCISLLKVLLTNFCINDCAYCINRKKNDIKRTFFTPEELAKITYEFYRRNYIEGLFLSSGIINNPETTMEMMIKTVSLLRLKYNFNGYIHLKIIPNTSEATVLEAIKWADRVSINLEFSNKKSFEYLVPDKKMENILSTMKFTAKKLNALEEEKRFYYSKAGQSTQLIIGATPETDYEILKLSSFLYKTLKLKRVYYSAYIPINDDSKLPTIKPPLLREHRLYQADWLIRFYGFDINEIVSEETLFLKESMDPKLAWALRNLNFFPVDIAKASLEALLRVPGIGPLSAKKIINIRKLTKIDFNSLKELGVVVKRAKNFITINGKFFGDTRLYDKMSETKKSFIQLDSTQYSLL